MYGKGWTIFLLSKYVTPWGLVSSPNSVIIQTCPWNTSLLLGIALDAFRFCHKYSEVISSSAFHCYLCPPLPGTFSSSRTAFFGGGLSFSALSFPDGWFSLFQRIIQMSQKEWCGSYLLIVTLNFKYQFLKGIIMLLKDMLDKKKN